MALKYYAGDRVTGTSGDTKPTTIPDGAIFTETDTLKQYAKVGGTWYQLVGASGGGGGGSGSIQVVNSQTGAYASGGTSIPVDDTIPQITEGDQYLSVTITPTNISNKLVIDVFLTVDPSGSGTPQITAALFQDSTATALACQSISAPAGRLSVISFRHYMTAGTTSATTFKVRAGASDARTIYVNGEVSRFFGGALATSITVAEIVSGGGGPTTQTDVTASRTVGTIYQNTTGNTMYVNFSGYSLSASSGWTGQTDSNASPTTRVASQNAISGHSANITFIVLPNNYYKITSGGSGATKDFWIEWS